MKIAVRYQSRSGNTRTVSQVIADDVGVKAESVDVPITESVDLLFVGGGVYAFSMDESLREFFAELDPAMVKSVAVFATSGFVGGTSKIVAAAKAKGIDICGEALTVKLGPGIHEDKPLPDKQLRKINVFVKGVLGG